MKFGGTSVEDATAIDRIAAIVKGRLKDRPYVVVSAMSKVTDTLLAMAAAAGNGERERALEVCHQVRLTRTAFAGYFGGRRAYAANLRLCSFVWRTALEHRDHGSIRSARYSGDFSGCAASDRHRRATWPRDSAG